jgi:glutathionyl-hydroquinone reductase
MGQLIDGEWTDEWYDTKKTQGKFVRSRSQFRSSIGSDRFPVEKDRYHLYTSYACPWAHRTLLYRKLKSLEDIISVSSVHPLMLDQGWVFSEDHPDPICNASALHQLYTRSSPHYSGRVTVPLLWDKKEQCAVNNESSELIRMFNSVFDPITGNDFDFYPTALRKDIDAINERVYKNINNGVYRAGFATSQAAYDDAAQALFRLLDEIEDRLSKDSFLVGDSLTEADIRLIPTLLRFDAVYVTHFKCDQKRLVDYHNLFNYTKQLIQIPGLYDTLNFEAIRTHYFRSHPTINAHGIISIGPKLNFLKPHDRKRDAMASVYRHPR